MVCLFWGTPHALRKLVGHGNDAAMQGMETKEPFPILRTAAWKTLVKLASSTFPRPRRRDSIRKTSSSYCFTKALVYSSAENAGRSLPGMRFARTNMAGASLDIVLSAIHSSIAAGSAWPQSVSALGKEPLPLRAACTARAVHCLVLGLLLFLSDHLCSPS